MGQPLLIPLVETQEEKLRDSDCGIVFGDQLRFGFGVGIVADEGADLGVAEVVEGGGVGGEGVEVVEEEEGGCWVGEGGGEEGMVGAEEGDAV